MSLWSALRGAVAQANPFDNGQTYGTFNPPQKKKQDTTQTSVSAPNPITVRQPQNNVPNQVSFGTLSQGTPNAVNVAKQSYQTAQALTPKPTPGPVDTLANDAKVVGGVATGVPLGVLRAGEGLAQGTISLPSMVLHANDWVRSKIAGKPVVNSGLTNVIDKATHTVAAPVDWLAKKTDEAALGYGPYSAQIYKPAQIAANIATIVPGAAEAGATVLSKAGLADRSLTKTLNTIGAQGKRPTLTLGRTKVPNVDQQAAELTATSDAAQAPAVTNIPVSQPVDIPVTNATPGSVNVPVKRTPTPLIQDVSGGAKTAAEASQKAATETARSLADRFNATEGARSSTGKPSGKIEGVSKAPSPTSYVTASDLKAERDALDQALANKEITKTQYKAANKALDENTPIDAQPTGKKIDVKTSPSIDVKQVDYVPSEDVAQPGAVRETTTTAPTQAKTEAVAKTPPALPKVGSTLPDGTVVTKRMVQSVRNQRNLANKLAKTQEQTAAAFERVNNAKPVSDKGFVQTGQYGKGVHGDTYQKVSRQAEQQQAWHDIQNKSTGEVLTQSEQEMLQNGARTEQTVRELKAKLADPNIPRNTPEGKALLSEYTDGLRRYAQGLALADRVVRAKGTAAQITNKMVNKLISVAKDSTKLTDGDIKQIENANNAFVEARDKANALAERFKATASEEDFNAWKQAQDAVVKADRDSKITEYTVAKRVLKDNKDDNALKAIQQMEEDAGVYTMDGVDANMLSGTGTWVRNYINTLFPRAESALFGKISSRLVKPIATVGGYSNKGSRIGAKLGSEMFKSDVNARKVAGAGFIRRNVTAANTIGERNIQATAYSKGYDYYKQTLKKEGYTGDELNRRAEFMTRTDGDGIVKQYEADALQANALSSLTHSKKMENWLADKIQESLAKGGVGAKGQQAGRFGAKAVTRVGIGFPTVIGRSLLEGAKRATLGIPEAIWSTTKYINTGNKEAFAQELAKSLQHAGSGATLMTLGAVLGRQGIITGGYPKDQHERDRWTAEGIQPNSIKIAGHYFSIPGYFGGFALPLMMGRALFGGGKVSDTASLQNAWQAVLDASPVDNIQSTLDILTGNTSEAKVKNQVTSLVRTFTPAGALLAEMAKLIDPTKNDTTTKSALMNIIDNIASGIPIVNNLENKTPKTDVYGNELKNPNPIATVLGAQGSEQPAGIQAVQQDQAVANSSLDQLRQYGVIDNQNLMGLVDKKLQAKIQRGQELKPEDIDSLQKSVTKGIGTGITPSSDSNWRENGDYATDRSATQVKLQMLEADPTAKKSEIANLKTQIARDNVLEKNQVPYDMLKLYEDTTQTEWAHMGDSTNDAYDPQTYQQLAQLDKIMQEVGGSYATDPTKNKYNLKSSGSGGGSSNKMTTSFGTLSSGSGSNYPQVRQYQTANWSTGNIPVINATQPNIVHKIGRG